MDGLLPTLRGIETAAKSPFGENIWHARAALSALQY
jgi:hypothetical protein